MKLHHRRLLTFSGWISLIANLLAITGFLLNHWPWGTWQPSQGFWIVFSFVTTVYSLVIWSIWTWRRSMGNDALQHTANKMRGGVFLLNAMAALPTLTLWLYLVLAALDDLLGTSALRWILALAIVVVGDAIYRHGFKLDRLNARSAPGTSGRSWPIFSRRIARYPDGSISRQKSVVHPASFMIKIDTDWNGAGSVQPVTILSSDRHKG